MNDDTTMNVYNSDFNIYPLKNEYIDAVKKNDIPTIEMLQNIDKNYYHLNGFCKKVNYLCLKENMLRLNYKKLFDTICINCHFQTFQNK